MLWEHRGHLTCTQEPGKEVTPALSHKGREEVSPVEAEGRTSEPGLGRDTPGPGAEREDLQWAQVRDLWSGVGVPRFRKGREGKATGAIW